MEIFRFLKFNRVPTIGIVAAYVAVAASLVAPWPPLYYQPPIRAQVVDNETLEPVAGAAVVGVWMLSHGGIEETWSTYRFEEAVTDSAGWFQLSGWRKWRRPFAGGRLKDQDPIIHIYKPGYRTLYLDNRIAYVQVTGRPGRFGGTIWTPVTTPSNDRVAERYPGWRWGGAKRYCIWSGKRIGMDRARNLDEEAHALMVQDALSRLPPDTLQHFPRIWETGRSRVPENLRRRYFVH